MGSDNGLLEIVNVGAGVSCNCLLVQGWKEIWRILVVFLVFIAEHFVLNIYFGV